MTNREIRLAAADAGVKLWQIADKLGITDSSFSRKLRKEFTTEEKERIWQIIAELKGGAANG
ncbi:hypothetical protein [Anaerotruncus rubiinfantis]|uniref:hypothetical protein n=1 Tax=Anaerotruncus rubiinfantis TaxID=1720200 RepID=UPI000837890A|nr:hypothetical protein [Anaerotruncus rubiinfantis]